MAVAAPERARAWAAPPAARRRLSRQDLAAKTLIYALLIVGSVIFVAPFAWMVTASLQDIGDMFRWKDYPHRACRFYELSIKRDPNRLSAHRTLGSLCFLMRDFTRAAAALDNVLDIDPTFHEAHFDLGRAHLHCDHQPEALRHLSAWLNMTSESTPEERVKAEWARKVVAELVGNGVE